MERSLHPRQCRRCALPAVRCEVTDLSLFLSSFLCALLALLVLVSNEERSRFHGPGESQPRREFPWRCLGIVKRFDETGEMLCVSNDNGETAGSRFWDRNGASLSLIWKGSYLVFKFYCFCLNVRIHDEILHETTMGQKSQRQLNVNNIFSREK